MGPQYGQYGFKWVIKHRSYTMQTGHVCVECRFSNDHDLLIKNARSPTVSLKISALRDEYRSERKEKSNRDTKNAHKLFSFCVHAST